MSDRDPRLERVGDLLGGLLRRWGIEREVARQGALDRWAEVVGAKIAGVTRARAVSAATLFVDVRSSAWMAELDLLRGELLKRLNAGAGEARVERIVFTLAEEPDEWEDR